ncbi:MAG: YggS family pyridoxal phosphate-dependent enzyme [Steroidobacteraceae bacterium]
MDAQLATRIRALRSSLDAACRACQRDPAEVLLVAVSKGHPADAVRSAARTGLEHFGESYVQEALPKLARLADMELQWHFIGRLQANKTRAVAEHFHWVHGVDQLKLAQRLSAQRPHYAPPLNVCIQVNIAGEAQKAGVAPGQLEALAHAVHDLPGLRLRGLMGILPAGLQTPRRRALFGQIAALAARLRRGGLPLDTLSMGMSDDYEDAIVAGATIVRIGTALFGTRI